MVYFRYVFILKNNNLYLYGFFLVLVLVIMFTVENCIYVLFFFKIFKVELRF